VTVGVREQVVVGSEPRGRSGGHPQIVRVGGETVVGGDAIVDLGPGREAVNREATVAVSECDVADVYGPRGAHVIVPVVAVAPRDVQVRDAVVGARLHAFAAVLVVVEPIAPQGIPRAGLDVD